VTQYMMVFEFVEVVKTEISTVNRHESFFIEGG